MDNQMKIIVPSRKRSQAMPRILKLLPDALICIDEREISDYRRVVPEQQLITHPATSNLSQVRNWIIEEIECRCLIQVDDDLKRVVISDGFSSRVTVDPDEIKQIFVNASNVCEDLGLGVFAFCRQPNPMVARQDETPFRLVGPVSCTFGMLGSARERLFDERFIGRDDFDWTMRTLIDDRVLFIDNRFYFDHGPIFSGRGGNVGLVNQKSFEKSSSILKQLYGNAINFSVSRNPHGKKQTRDPTSQMSIRVTRKQRNIYQ